jgi:hypothetical protein
MRDVGHGAGQRTQRFSHGLRAPDRARFHGTTPTAGHGDARKPSGVEISHTDLLSAADGGNIWN